MIADDINVNLVQNDEGKNDYFEELPEITSEYVQFLGRNPKSICLGFLIVALALVIYAIGLLSSFSNAGGFQVRNSLFVELSYTF